MRGRGRMAGERPRNANLHGRERKPRADSLRTGKLRVGFSLPMDVLLVDDHPIIHETLAAVLRSVAPEAQMHSEGDLGNAISRARQLKDLELVMLDLGLPGFSGIEALLRFRKAMPRTRVVIISANEEA